MLYVIHMGNQNWRTAAQGPMHLEADGGWANSNSLRWAFTSSNAGSRYFEDYSDLAQLDKIDWDAVQANNWAGERKEPKQAEFLIEGSFPWELVSRFEGSGCIEQVMSSTDQAGLVLLIRRSGAMIEYKTGEALVNSVNCVGFMGRGIALVQEHIPELPCSSLQQRGPARRMFVFETQMANPRYIINFPTKRHWRGKSRISKQASTRSPKKL